MGYIKQKVENGELSMDDALEMLERSLDASAILLTIIKEQSDQFDRHDEFTVSRDYKMLTGDALLNHLTNKYTQQENRHKTLLNRAMKLLGADVGEAD